MLSLPTYCDVCNDCREAVQTVAVNQSLKQLIDGFVEQKAKVICDAVVLLFS